MWNKLFRFIILAIVILEFSSDPLLSQDSENIVLRWENVPGALGYVIEIRDSSNKVLDSKRLSSTSFQLTDYQPGVYEHRVGVINKFGKVENFTEWSKFEVVRTKEPSIQSQKVFSAGMNEASKKIEIQGKDFLPSMKVYLNKAGRKIEPISYEVKSDSEVVADFRMEDLKDLGMYDIVLENPKQKKAVHTKSFILGKTKEQAEKIALKQAKILNNEVPSHYYDTPYWSTLWRSSIVPGWGQSYIDDAKWKLKVYPVLLIVAGAVLASSYQDYTISRQAYNNSVRSGIAYMTMQPSGTIFLLNRHHATSRFNRSEKRLDRVQFAGGMIGIFLIYNWVDAILSVRRNVAKNESNSDIEFYIPGSDWRIGASSSIRPSAEWERSNWETYTNLEFNSRF